MSKDDDSIKVLIDGVQRGTEALGDWNATVYEIDGLARGEAERVKLDAIEPDAVLELELANGNHILVAAADAGRYLGEPVDRGGDVGEALEIGQVLRFSGTRLPHGVSRDGLGAWVLKGLKIFRRGPAAMTALIAAGAFQDAQLDDRDGLYRCATDGFRLTRVDALPKSDEAALIFIHGTASSTEGSFRDLWANPDYLGSLVKGYGARIYAFEHRSLTESPIANALALVERLPVGARVHLVSHSRGGMIGELLARANRVDLEPFTDDEVERFVQHAGRARRDGSAFEADARRLRELNQALRSRKIVVERFVRVACPARGTTLASGRLDRWASVMLNLLGRGFDAAGNVIPGMVPVAKGYGLLKQFLLAVVGQRTDARILPGIEAMMPDSPLVGLLNAPDVNVLNPVHVVAGDYQGDGLLAWLGDCLTEVFYGGQTDLVVNTPSMSGGAARVQGIYLKPTSGPQVTHFSYFENDESALPLLGALHGDDSPFELLQGPSRAAISRGGRKPKPKKDAPIVCILPGIMGSHIQLGRNRIWFEPISMWSGEMERLRIGAGGEVSADGWMDRSYEDLARFLADTHEVRPFAYDWRLSITDAARKFGKVLADAMDEAESRRQPLRIVAHSMGGLVARLALQDQWDRFKAIPGSRLLQLGTPNRGSHSIAAVLMARDDFVQLIERWFDWKHNMREFLEIVRDFPGVLELLPWPGEDGRAGDGVDYFDAGLWKAWYEQDRDPKRDSSWLPPQKDPLGDARKAIGTLQAAALDPECTLYVAGHAPTPNAVRVVDGRVEIGTINEGDGRVPWKTGIPAGVPVWYVDASHGDLANHEPAFQAYLDLLNTGDTRQGALTRTPPVSRGDSVPVFQARGLDAHALYPSVDEVLAAAVGGTRPSLRPVVAREPLAMLEVFHGSLASAEAPVLIGAYANDSLRGSAKVLDAHLGGQLQRTFDLGRYPSEPGDAMVFMNPEPGGKPSGAIVVGLGTLGDLLPGMLTRALTNGLLEFARNQEQCQSSGEPGSTRLVVCALLVGTGFTGLTIEVGSRCLLDALRLANEALRRIDSRVRIGRLRVYEEAEDRAVAVVESFRELLRDAQFEHVAQTDGRLHIAAGGYRGRCTSSAAPSGAYRVLVVDENGSLRFTVITDRARNEVAIEPDQRQAVDGLIDSITGATRDQPGLSRALFELLVPNGMKEAVAQVRSLMMSVDAKAASYPWELMRDSDPSDDGPLSTRVELVRQLASAHGRGRVPTVTEASIFIVGDTQSGMVELKGAQKEAEIVAAAFRHKDYQTVNLLLRASPQLVFDGLFNGRYRIMHLAGHGVVREGENGLTGMVLGPHTYLTPAQVSKLRHVPEFVFINCCYLGSTKDDAQPRWGRLAANLATQFIEMGCKAVIAAGWAVDDNAANLFAEVFYEAMLDGQRFGEAVRRARDATFRRYRQSNTWGAYQAYGDELYRFADTAWSEEQADEYVNASRLIADLDMYAARLQGATDKEKHGYYYRQIEKIEQLARVSVFQNAGVREKLAAAWAELGEMERAINHYRAALGMEDAAFSLKALEQLANQETRYGARLLEDTATGRYALGSEYLKTAYERLKQLIAIAPTVERYSLLGSYWKRRARAERARGNRSRVKGHLGHMREAYWDAAEYARQRTGEWHYYPLFNALDGDFLAAAWNDRKTFDARAGQLPDLLQAGRADAQRKLVESRDFFNALADAEAQRIDALWACYDGRDKEAITNTAVAARLATVYLDVMRRIGSAREHDSAADQFDFLVRMLPTDNKADEVKRALSGVALKIRQAAD
ncbi:MAG: CHAT domain-containing protein [Gammaproteobacteria bacterium]|nr:CHAT domain-containing protein [Gammaproteobacteria bacterium]